MAGKTIEMHGHTFTLRRLTGRTQIALAEPLERVNAASDRMFGLRSEIQHTAQRMSNLGYSESDEFDAATRDALVARRAELRRAMEEASRDWTAAQAELFAARIEPVDGVDADWMLDNLEFPGDVEKMQEFIGGAEPDGGDVPPTAAAGEPSST